MKIVVEDQDSGTHLLFILLVGALAMGSGYAFAVLKSMEAGMALAGAALVVAAIGAMVGRSRPLLLLDDSGIFDARLGVGKILWKDIEDVQIEGGYGNRFLCFRVRNPDAYVARLKGVQKTKIKFQHDLGFRRFNVDMKGVEVNLLDLKKQIELRLNRRG